MATGIENLKIWKLAHLLETKIYEITAKFPLEAHILRRVNQVRRSSSSVTDNIVKVMENSITITKFIPFTSQEENWKK